MSQPGGSSGRWFAYREGCGVLAREVLAAAGDGEFAVFDALSGDQLVGDLLDRGGLAADDEDLKAIVVVEVDMEGGNDDLVVVVLDVGEGGLDVLLVVVVNEGDGAGDFLVAEVLAVLDEAGADHVRHGQRAVVLALLAGHLIELFGQVARNGNGKADNAVGFVGFHAGDGNKGSEGVNRSPAYGCD